MDSRYFSTHDLVTMLAALVVGSILAVLAAAALLRLSMQWLERARPGFLRCLGGVLLGGTLGTAASYTVMTVAGMVALVAGFSLFGSTGMGVGMLVASSALSFVLTVFGLAAAVHWLMRAGDGETIPFKRAIAVAACTVALWAVLYVACIAASLAALGGIPGVAR
jgi:hypothetical protein